MEVMVLSWNKDVEMVVGEVQVVEVDWCWRRWQQ